MRKLLASSAAMVAAFAAGLALFAFAPVASWAGPASPQWDECACGASTIARVPHPVYGYICIDTSNGVYWACP